MTFGDKLKEARKRKNLTQEQLAKMIGVAKTTLTGYEKGNREPDVNKIKKIIDILEISSSWLLDTAEVSVFAKDEIDIIKNYRLLDERGKAVVLDVMLRELQYANKSEISAAEIIDTLKNISNKVNAVNTVREGIKK